MSHRIFHYARLVFVGFAAVLLTQLVFASTPKKRVIAIEAAMRMWQERYMKISPFSAYWYERSDLTEPGKYPEDGFYGEDLLDPEKAALLVDNLYREMEWDLSTFIKNPDALVPGQLEGYSLREIPRPTPENYVEVFTKLVEILKGLHFNYLSTTLPSAITSAKYGAAQVAHGSSCDTLKAAILSRWTTSGSGSSTTPTITRRELLARPQHYYPNGSLETRAGKFQYNLSRFNGTAKHYERRTTTVDYVNLEQVYIFSENATTGGIWISKEVGWKTADITQMNAECPAFGSGIDWRQTIYSFLVVNPIYTNDIPDLWAEIDVTCQTCGEDCELGATDFQNGCIDTTFHLGRDSAGRAGSLRLKAEIPALSLATPWALQRTLRQGMVTLFDQTMRDAANLPMPRQFITPQGAVDVVVLNGRSYELRFYAASQVGPAGSDGFYTFTGDPMSVAKIENPDDPAQAYNRLRITSTRGGVVDVADYAYDASTQGWTLARSVGGKTRNEVRNSTFDSATGRRIETHVLVDEAGRIVINEQNSYQTFPWNTAANASLPEELVEHIDDPAGVARPTTYSFYTDAAADGPNYGHVKLRVDPAGSWQKFEYDSAGRVNRLTTPFLNAVPGSSSGVRIRETTFSDSFPNETVVESLVLLGGARVELRRSYRNFDYNEITSITARNPGAPWNDATNLISITKTDGTGNFNGRITASIQPDGTGTLYSYQANADGSFTTTSTSGALNAAKNAVTDGTRTVSTVSKAGELIDERVYDIASGLLLSMRTVTQTDDLGRATRIDYLDGTHEIRSYACCGLDYIIDREGVRTDYGYDEFRRLARETRAGVTTRYTYDGLDRVLTVVREGSDQSTVQITSNSYDTVGRIHSTTAAGNRTTVFDETIDGSGQTVKTTTGPDQATRVETFAIDGTLLSVGGTAVAPLKYEYGADADGYFVKEIKLGENGAETEWTKTYSDMLGQDTKTVFAGGASVTRSYNSVGQLTRQVDPDGIATLFAYNSRGGREVIAIDVNGNDTIDLAGPDRVTKTVNTVGTRDTYAIRVSTTQVWESDDQDTPTTVSVSEESADGLRSWQTVRGLTTSLVMAFDGNGGRTIATTSPDGTVTTQAFVNGRLVSGSTSHPSLGMLGSASYGYDAHGRLQSMTDARTGTTTYIYFADDQIRTVTTPDPDPGRSGPGYDPQTTTFGYDAAGRQNSVTHPDGGVVTTEYYPAGQVKKTFGARTYPVEYTYDTQGRVKTLTTWQNFASAAGAAVTTWNYHPFRGWLENKRYADSTGPSYTYKPSGRLQTRTWARGIVTTYGYNPAGDLESVDYSDLTPDVTIQFDRVGRPKNVTDGAGTRTLDYDPVTGQLKDEDYTVGLLANLGVHRTFDSQARIDSLSANSASSALNQIGYSYDPASRLDTVTSGANTATYGYVPNSPLVQTITFRQGAAIRLTTTKVYDNLNRLVSITNTHSASSPLSVFYQYNAANQRTCATREDNAYWQYEYDPLGQVTVGRKHLSTEALINGLDFAWSFDDIGNRKTATTNGQTSTYTPTLLNQYDNRSVPGFIDVLGSAQMDATVTVMSPAVNGSIYSTSRQGELFYAQLTADNSTAAQYPNIKITGVKNNVGPAGEDAVTEVTRNAFVPAVQEIHAHDADGNLLADARWTYTWDAENRLIAMETSGTAAAAGVPRQKLAFVYDGQSRRVAKQAYAWDTDSSAWVMAASQRFVYGGWSLLAEVDDAGTAEHTYVWGLDLSGSLQGAGGVGGLLFVNSHLPTPNSAAYAAAFDGNGNVIGYVDMATGAKSATYEYGVFGETLIAEGVAHEQMPFRFSTKFTDDETGLLYYGFRYYNPTTGCWLNRELLGEGASANLYTAASNDLTNNTDVLGLYQVDGHYYHMLSTLVLSGVPVSTAKELAFYSQLPDELKETTAFDTHEPGVTVGKIARRDEALRDIGNWIHSLGLGRTADVEKRRCCLSNLLKDGSLSNMQKGLVLHALGDAFSHTYETHDVITQHKRQYSGPTYTTGYPEYFGHAGHGTRPDIIAKRPKRYVDFIQLVQQSVNPGANLAALAPLTSRILNKNDPIHQRKNGRYPSARALAQQITGDPLAYQPEAIEEHTFLQKNPDEPYALPTAQDIERLIQLMKSRCRN